MRKKLREGAETKKKKKLKIKIKKKDNRRTMSDQSRRHGAVQWRRNDDNDKRLTGVGELKRRLEAKCEKKTEIRFCNLEKSGN